MMIAVKDPKWIEFKMRKHPEAIFIQLNTFCNATCINCPHPFTYKEIHEKGTMSEKTWQKILSDLIAMDFRGQVGFYLHHEPLLDKGLYDKIKDVNSKTNAYVVISTNGSLLNDINRKNLITARPQKVHVNINSGIEDEYEKSMGLDFQNTIRNTKNFLQEANGLIEVEINCPVMEGYNVKSLKELFPTVKVNLDYYANSRGGLLPDLFGKVKGSHFKMDEYCVQPSQNFNILFDGSVVVCCIDWMHESKKDYGNINDSTVMELYLKVQELEEVFKTGNYSKYKMCEACSTEMGFNKNSDGSPRLKILITNHHLMDYAGSEILTLTLADYLSRIGHNVTVYSKYVGLLEKKFQNLNIRVVDTLEHIKNEFFDIAHVHHNIPAIEIRNIFPKLPIVFFSQGILPFLEQPPLFEVGINKFIALSEEVKENLLSHNILDSKIVVIRNLIDTDKLANINHPREFARNVLVISGRLDEFKEKIIREACLAKGLNLEFIGGRFGVVDQCQVSNKIEWSDIVISIGRGAIEGLIAGRGVIVYDYLGGDGMVTLENYSEIKKNNFSGRRYKYDYNVDHLISELEKYNFQTILTLQNIATVEFGASNAVKQLNKIYDEVLSSCSEKSQPTINLSHLKFVSNVINETYNYSFEKGQRKSPTEKSENNSNSLIQLSEKFMSSKKYETAMDILNEVIAQEPNNPYAINNLAEIKIINGNTFDAYLLLMRVLHKNENNEGSRKRLQLLEQKNILRKKELKWNSKKSAQLLLGAEQYISAQKLERAKRNLLEVLNYEPENLEALNDYSVVLILENEYSKAKEVIDIVLKQNSDNEIASGNLAYLIENNLIVNELDAISEYDKKIKRELEIYENQNVVHNLPNCHSIYTSKTIGKSLHEFTNTKNFPEWCASEIDNLIQKLNRKVYCISIGCGNGDSEISVLKHVKNKDKVEFVGVDINPSMLERGKQLAKENGLDMMMFQLGDFNSLKLDRKYDFFFANHSLHHVVELENLFETIVEGGTEDMVFMINDMIGRNGHVLWDGTKQAVDIIWNKLDYKYRKNAYSRIYDAEVMNNDCSTEGFEGIRAQDILPLLMKYFDYEIYMPFSVIISRFIDRAYGHNFEIANNEDMAILEKIIDMDIKILFDKKLSPTQALMKFVKKGYSHNQRFTFQPPEETIKARDYYLEENYIEMLKQMDLS